MDSSNDENSSFDLENMGSLTPMNSSFLSPIKKFDNLNLNNLSDIQELEVGNQTIDEDSDSGSETGVVLTEKPVFKKRKRANVSDVEMITPSSESNGTKPDSNSMSVCTDNITSVSLLNLKLSFSNSDSTPCPVPAKKKMRFKLETPVPKNKLLNLQNSIKTNVADVLYDFDYHTENNEYLEETSPIEILKTWQNSTPISQLTPANSRAASPQPESPSPSQGDPELQSDEIVSEQIHPPLSYQTPVLSRNTINGYNLINKEVSFEIIGDLTNGSDVHPADQRIEIDETSSDPRQTDPYLHAPPTPEHSVANIRMEYMTNPKTLPLLKDMSQEPLENVIDNLTEENLTAFYEYIRLEDEQMVELLRQERIKWHPDKNKFHDKQIVHTISSCINALLTNS